MKMSDEEFQEAAMYSAEKTRDLVIALLERDDQTPNTVISGASMAICMAQVSMKPEGMSMDKATFNLMTMIAAHCAQITGPLEKIETDEEEEPAIE